MAAQFDAVKLRSGALVVVLQSDLVDYLPTRLVAPLLRIDAVPSRMERLNPVFTVDGRDWLLAAHLLATVPVGQLGKVEFSLSEHEYTIKNAVDMLTSGY